MMGSGDYQLQRAKFNRAERCSSRILMIWPVGDGFVESYRRTPEASGLLACFGVSAWTIVCTYRLRSIGLVA